MGDPAFAFASDETHVYVGFGNNRGVLRWDGKALSPPKTIATGMSAWSLAMTHDHIYFDDHGGGGDKQSVGIYRLQKSK